jgi:hypothetical protein
MSNYWRDMYGARGKDFTEGVIAGVEAYATWRDGEQLVGCMQIPLKEVIREVKEGLGWKDQAVEGADEQIRE